MPQSKAERKVRRSFISRYGKKRGVGIFMAKVNKGGRFAKAMGAGARKAARSGGRGRRRRG